MKVANGIPPAVAIVEVRGARLTDDESRWSGWFSEQDLMFRREVLPLLRPGVVVVVLEQADRVELRLVPRKDLLGFARRFELKNLTARLSETDPDGFVRLVVVADRARLRLLTFLMQLRPLD